MNNLNEYLTELIRRIDHTESADQLEWLSEKFDKIADSIVLMRKIAFDRHLMDDELCYQLDADLEHYEALAIAESKRALACIDELDDTDPDEHRLCRAQMGIK